MWLLTENTDVDKSWTTKTAWCDICVDIRILLYSFSTASLMFVYLKTFISVVLSECMSVDVPSNENGNSAFWIRIDYIAIYTL